MLLLTATCLFACNKGANNTVVNTKQEEKIPEMENTFPYSEAAKVELISFSHLDFRPEEYDYKIVDGKLAFDESIIKERISLSKRQQESLFWELTTDDCPQNYEVADCYMPEHRIIFYDKDDKVIAFLEICIQCVGSRKSENFKVARLCGIKMKELKKLFRSAGIRHFSEM